MRDRNSQRGSALLIVLVLAAMVLIGAASFGVVYLRQLNQQRQLQTQKYLEAAFQGLFGAYRKQAGNLNADFGYYPVSPGAPPTHYYDLKLLVDRAAVLTSDPTQTTLTTFGGTLSGTKFGAWNGPYWTGPVDGSNLPVDAWGRPLQLRYISTSSPVGWQVYSLGANGVSETGDAATPSGDDQVYPNPPYMPTASASATADISLTITITNNSGSTLPAAQVIITDSIPNTQSSAKAAIPKNQTRSYTFTSNVKSGSITLVITTSHGTVSYSPATTTLSSSPTTQTIFLTVP